MGAMRVAALGVRALARQTARLRPGLAVPPVAALSSSTADTDRVAMVQGSSRGLGLEFCKQLLDRPNQRGATEMMIARWPPDVANCSSQDARPDAKMQSFLHLYTKDRHFTSDRVVATCRDPASATDLHALQSEHPHRLSIVRLDAMEEASIQSAAEEISKLHGHLDLLLNVAGLLHVPGVMSPETALSRLEGANLLRSFQTNAMGPILVCKAMLPLLAAARDRTGADDSRPAVIGNMSARVGSISDNSLGGWYSYRASKTALNQLTKTLSLEIARRKHKVAAVLLHPGTCDTDMSLPFKKNVPPGKLFSRERAVRQLLGLVDGVTIQDNGRYVAWDGEDIPF